MSDRAKIVQIYVAFYDRAPDPAGLTFWQTACNDGLSLEAIANLFVPQDESVDTYPFLGNPTEEGIRSFLQDVYDNLFHRGLDPEGETFWTNQILKSIAGDPDGMPIGEVVLSIICGAQGDDITTLANKTTIALDWHDQAALVPDYVQTDAAKAASKLALGVVDETDFSLVQGQVLNENYFEDLASGLTPFAPGDFNPLIPTGETGVDEVQANGLILGSQVDPVVAVLADGRIVTVYEERFTSSDLAFQIRNADGSLTIPDISVASTLPYSRFDLTFNGLAITALPDGGFIILTEASIPDEPNGLYSLRFDDQGMAVGDPVLIASYDEFSYFDGFDVTYLSTGNVLYTFSGDPDDLDFEDTFTKVLTLEGETVVDTQVVNDNDGTNEDEDDPAAAALPDGTTLVVYNTGDSAFDGDGDAIMGRIFDPDGVALDDPFVINQFVTNNQRNPAVAALGEDRFVVVFESDSGEFGEDATGIVAVILDEDGDVKEDEFQINVSTSGDKTVPQVVALPDGNFVAVWRTDTPDSEIRARVFEDDGTPVTGEIMVNTFTDGFQSDPQLAASEDGFVVTWENNGVGNDQTPEDPFLSGIRMAAFDQDGVRVQLPDAPNPNIPVLMTEEFQVNNEIALQQSEPSVVGLADGRSVFSYFDLQSNESLFEVRDANGLPLTDEAIAFGAGTSMNGIEMFATPDGGFVMVGAGTIPDGQGEGILMQIFDSDLTPGAVIRVNQTAVTSGNSRGPEVAVDGDGIIYVGWTFSDVFGAQMMLRPFADDGTALRDAFSLSAQSVGDGGVTLDALTVTGDGRVLAVGEVDELISGTSDSDLFGAVLELMPSPTGFIPNFSFSGALPIDHTGNQLGVTAAPLENGNFLIAFGSNPAPGDPAVSGVSGIIINPNGQAVGSQFLVNTSTAGNQSTPDATVLSDGRVLVTWAGENTTGVGLGQDIFGRVFDTDGTPDGGEFILNAIGKGNQTLPDVAAAGDGFAAIWLTDPNFVGPIQADIKGAVFDENFDPILTPLVVPTTAESFLSVSDLVDLQQDVLPGATTFAGLFPEISSGGSIAGVLGDSSMLVYQPGGDLNLALGETGTEIFGYRVSDGVDDVNVVGSFTLQGFEDYVT